MGKLLTTSAKRPKATLLLAHGAGAPMDSPFMAAIAEAIAARDITVVRFEFEYMAARRQGTRKPPSRMPLLIQNYQNALATALDQKPKAPLLIGGKSLGGRVASMIASDAHASGMIDGCFCLGYPFHPVGKPAELRTAHLVGLSCPTLIVQGERDPLGNRTEVAALKLSKAIQLIWMPDGDHDLRPRRSSGHTFDEAIETAANAIAQFAAQFTGSNRSRGRR